MKRIVGGVLALILALLGLACDGNGPSTEGTSPGQKAEIVTAVNGDAADSTEAMPVPELGYNAREGHALFQHYCATCHGTEGWGDGFNAFNLDPRPRDLSDEAFQSEKTDAELVDVIMIGGGAAGKSTAMPPWGGTLSKRQVHNLVVYLRTLSPEE